MRLRQIKAIGMLAFNLNQQFKILNRESINFQEKRKPCNNQRSYLFNSCKCLLYSIKKYWFSRMKEQTNDENIQLLLKQFQIQHPRRKCQSGNPITEICINHQCESNALLCQETNCNSCSKAHLLCQRIVLTAFTHLLKRRTEGQRQFIIKVFQIENSMIQEIQKKRKAIVEKFYLGDLQPKYLKIIEQLYVKNAQNFQLKGALAQQTYGVLKRTLLEVLQPDRQLLQRFKTEVQTITKNLNDSQTKLIDEFIKKSKTKAEGNILQGSTIITKETPDYQRHLKQWFPGVKRFQLIFRASQNGFQAAKFHQSCNDIRHTFTLVKNEFGKIIGGYTPLKWNQVQGNAFVKDQENLSFLLSFNLGQKMRLTNNTHAVYNRTDYGPTFGGGHDLHISNKCNQNNSCGNLSNSYNCNGQYSGAQQTNTSFTGAASGSTFKVIQYEVYKVIW